MLRGTIPVPSARSRVPAYTVVGSVGSTATELIESDGSMSVVELTPSSFRAFAY